MPEGPSFNPLSSLDLRQVNFLVVGLGRLGLDVVRMLAEANFSGATLLALSNDKPELDRSNADVRLVLSADQKQVLCDDIFLQFKQMLDDTDFCFIVSDCRDPNEQAALGTISRIAREMNVFSIAWVDQSDRPYKPEASDSRREKYNALQSTARMISVVPVSDNEGDRERSLPRSERIFQHITALKNLICQPSLLNVDSADVKSILEAKGFVSAGLGEASGKNRATEALMAALADSGILNRDLADAEGILVNLIGGAGVGMTELDKAIRLLRQQISQRSNVIVGMTFDPSSEEELRVQVVLAGRLEKGLPR